MPANYSALSVNGKSGYHFPLANVQIRRISDPANVWMDAGDVDNFKFNWTTDKKTRYRRNAGRRTVGDERVVQLDGNVTFVPFQRTPFFKALALMGVNAVLTQEAGADLTVSAKAFVGDFIVVPDMDISSVAATDWVENTHFKVVDGATGLWQIIALPNGVVEGDVVVWTYDRAAIVAGDKRSTCEIGEVSSVPVALRIREITDGEQHELIEINYVEASVDGDMTLIGEDDFVGMTFSGRAQDRGNGLGRSRTIKAGE